MRVRFDAVITKCSVEKTPASTPRLHQSGTRAFSFKVMQTKSFWEVHSGN
jgi:hypothetical protein